MMGKKICGIKLTHDGGIALIDGNKLIFSYEMEKFNNNFRYSTIEDTKEIEELLNKNGYELNDIDHFAIDGWDGLETSSIFYKANGQNHEVQLAPYRETKLSQNILERHGFNDFAVGNEKVNYSSYYHVTGHVMGAYCSSPFAKENKGSYVLVWDGGMFPQFYYVDPKKKEVESFGKLFFLIGNIYSSFPLYFEPFRQQRNSINVHLSIAGKVMAYIANGEAKEEIIEDLTRVYEAQKEYTIDSGDKIARDFLKLTKGKGYSNEDVLASFHVFIERLLLTTLKEKLERYPKADKNLCFAGGCALNIKWNSAIRKSELFDGVWVPPFPNDSGSAIGVACAEMVNQTGNYDLEWTVYAGPELNPPQVEEGWTSRECSIDELASLLHEEQKAVVFLNGKAELGPRALGNRGLLAAPTSEEMKVFLNHAKKREGYRPVAPICIEEKASEVFNPGTEDRYMLFDHLLKEEWSEKVPAIKHIDESARVQTVSADSNPIVYELLTKYEKLSGVPVLTNTSANLNGKGFFPDVQSAMRWEGCPYVWSDGTLYYKKEE